MRFIDTLLSLLGLHPQPAPIPVRAAQRAPQPWERRR